MNEAKQNENEMNYWWQLCSLRVLDFEKEEMKLYEKEEIIC